MPCGSGHGKVRFPHVSGWTDPLYRALEPESGLCASESVGSLLSMPFARGDEEVTGTGGRTGLSRHSWRGKEET